jgi:hypothetical protein
VRKIPHLVAHPIFGFHLAHLGRTHRVDHRRMATTQHRRLHAGKIRYVVKDHRVLDVGRLVMRILNDEHAEQSAQDAHLHAMVVIPTRARWIGCVLVDESLSVQQRRLRHARGAVHSTRQLHAVPMHRRRNRRLIYILDTHALSVANAQQWTGNAAVVADRIDDHTRRGRVAHRRRNQTIRNDVVGKRALGQSRERKRTHRSGGAGKKMGPMHY